MLALYIIILVSTSFTYKYIIHMVFLFSYQNVNVLCVAFFHACHDDNFNSFHIGTVQELLPFLLVSN